MKFTLPNLRWNVAILNSLAGLFFLGMIGMWLWMVDRIDDKFEIADNRNREIARDVGDIKAAQAAQSSGINEILRRLDDDKPETSNRGE